MCMYIFSSLFTYMVVWVSDFVMVNILLWCVCVCVSRDTAVLYHATWLCYLSNN